MSIWQEHTRFITALIASLLTLAGSGMATLSQARTMAPTRNAEDLLIVDCLLPGQLRKLGSVNTFMSARRPIRTTQADCEIRGGEYVSYDRANYQTALKIWQGQAEAGDANAQNNLGEIYQKGLGTNPDYSLAAHWFEKAAAQGLKRAKINLGYLYEQGLGVTQDLPKALDLYREASGISGDKLVFASSISAQTQQAQTEIAQLRQQVASEQQQGQQLRAQVEDLKRQLQQKQQSYQQSQSELNQIRTQLDRESSKLNARLDPQYKALQDELLKREQDLLQKQQNLEAEKQSNNKKLDSKKMELEQLQAREQTLRVEMQSNQGKAKELEDLRKSAAALNVALGEAHERQQALQVQLDKNEQDKQNEQVKFDLERARMAQQLAKNDDNKKLLRLMEEQLAEKRQQVDAQREQMKALQTQIDAGKISVGSSGTVLAANGVKVEILQPALSLTRGQQPAASVPRAQNGMDVVGRVQASGGVDRITVNNQSVAADAAGMFKAHVVTGADNTPVRVTAIDKRGQNAVLDFLLVPNTRNGGNANVATTSTLGSRTTPRGLQLGKFYALIIGNDQYQNYTGLKSAASDAAAIAQLLKNNYGYDTRLLKNANRFEMLSALNDLREQLKDSDNLLVYFAGHGEIEPQSKLGYWLPVDAQPNQPTGWISNRAISDILTTMEARHVLVIADSCYSGTMTRSSLASFDGAMPDSAWNDWVKNMSNGRSRTALTSGGVQPVPDSQKGEHSLFAGVLLAVLGDNNQLLTGQRLFREVASSMALKESAGNLLQSPEYAPIQYAGHEAGEFFFQPRKNG